MCVYKARVYVWWMVLMMMEETPEAESYTHGWCYMYIGCNIIFLFIDNMWMWIHDMVTISFGTASFLLVILLVRILTHLQ